MQCIVWMVSFVRQIKYLIYRTAPILLLLFNYEKMDYVKWFIALEKHAK